MQEKTLRLVAVAMLLAACSASADNATFPLAGGDLASASDWGVESLDGYSSMCALLTQSGTYTASSDIDFAGMSMQKKNGEFIIDMTAAATGAATDTGRVVNLTAALSMRYEGNHTTIKGGTWKLNSKNIQTYSGWAQGPYNVLRIKDAAVSGVNYLAGGYGSKCSEIWIDGSSLSASTIRPDYDKGSSSLLVITNGSKVSCGRCDANNSSYVASGYDYCAKTIITGEDTSFNTTSSFYMGSTSFTRFTVTDGASCALTGTVYIGSSGGVGTNSVFTVTDGAKCYIKGNVYFSQYYGWNTIAVTDGGSLTISDQMILNGNASGANAGHDSTLLISNGVYRAPSVPSMGSSSAKCGSNGVVRIVGRRSVFDIATTGPTVLFLWAPHCRYEIVDAAWTNNVSSYLRYNYSSGVMGCCTMELSEGAEYYSTNSFYIANADYTSTNNSLRVLSGSRLYAGKGILSSSCGNSFVVSNATMETKGNFTVCLVSHSNYMNGYSNNWLVVQGDSPAVIATNGTLGVAYQSHLQFDLPSRGYADGCVPIRADKLNVASGCELIFNGAAERVAELRQSEHVTLAETSSGVTVASDVLAAVNETLPENSFCYVSDDGKKLMLKLHKDTGTLVIIR